MINNNINNIDFRYL